MIDLQILLYFAAIGTSKQNTVHSVLSGLCLKRTSVLSGQIVWYRQNSPLFQY